MLITISIDAMGGDYGPSEIIPGLALALTHYSAKKPDLDLRFLIFGDEALVQKHLKHHPTLNNHCEVIHSKFHATNIEKPAHIVRRGVQTSLGAAVKAVAEGKSQGVVSCANTGAFMALSKIYLKTFKGVLRPAIPAFIPTRRGHTLMLDLGANVECSAHMLLQFALMGSIYVKTCLGTENPTVGILNIGEEEMKGTEAVQDAAQLFREHPKINYVGFIEGDKITQGLVDVIITDGFTGNVALKTLEGTAHFITQLLTQVFQSSWQTKLAYKLCEKALGQVAQTMDKRSYNGAPFLGISGVAIKSHGSSDRKGFANAISVAIDMVENQLPVHLEQQFKMDT